MKKINEDIQQGEYSADLPEEIYDYMSQATLDGEPFYIVWDITAIEDILGTRGDRASTEQLLTDTLGDNWGYEDDWRMCDSCNKALYYYDGDYWLDYNDGTTICSDCLHNERSYQKLYIDFLKNNPDECNQFLEDSILEELGWIKLEGTYANDYYGNSDIPEKVMDELTDKYPSINFIFSSERSGPWGTCWSVWADQELPDDEEEESSEEQ